MRVASLGSVSQGTLRSADLVEAFYGELETQILRQTVATWNHDKLDKLQNTLQAAENACWHNNGELIDDEELLAEWVEQLMSALSEFAPPYCFFGSHLCDGTDFGYWADRWAIDELPTYGTTDEAFEAGEEGDFKVVDSLGNFEAYACDGELLVGTI